MEPIAIIGMSCRFPGAGHPEALWKLLIEGKDAIMEVPSDRWDVNEYYTLTPVRGKMCTRWGGFIEQVDKFDAAFFGISPREASYMDPQQRVVLEVAWEALEHAGVAPAKLAGSRTGVFIGVSNYDYNRILCRSSATLDAYCSTGTILAITANRLSYLLNLRGPSLVVDTACSSSLVSTHLACQSLRTGESDVAIAGGVNLILSPEVTIILSQGGLMSPDGRCKAFDAGANGYVRSEGCGMLVLKRLSDAHRDGNAIMALIRGSAVNQDGCTNGLTAPSATAQQDVIRQALTAAEARADQLSYVEAHGSGTRLGDIIETRALRAVLLENRLADNPCAIGSVKTNIGHTESAAGVAGLMKVILSLQHGIVPANLHLKKLNPHIRIENTPLFVPTELHPWPLDGTMRLAGVSSFGIGGTNAHVIVEEAPKQISSASGSAGELRLLTLSAKTANSLRAMVQNYQAFLAESDQASLADLCFTASYGRSHFPHRVAFGCKTIENLREQLSALPAGDALQETGSQHGSGWQAPAVALLFTGQGAEYLGFGRKLYETEPAFREAFDHCDELLGNRLDRSISFLFSREAAFTSAKGTAPYFSFFAFGFQYALAELWRSWGIQPTAVLGFRIGEIVAACIAGALTLADGLKVVGEIAELTKDFPPLDTQGLFLAEETNRSGAIESPFKEAVEKTISEICLLAPRINLISSVNGEMVEANVLENAEYYQNLMLGAARPVAAFKTLEHLGIRVLLELGPGSNVGELGLKCLPENFCLLLHSLSPQKDDGEQMLESLGEMYVRGVEVNWSGLYRREARHLISLPTYPFERKRFWFNNADVPNNVDREKVRTT